MSVSYAVGIDAGGTNVKGVAMDRSGGILLRRSIDVGERILPDAVREMYAALQPLLGSPPKYVCIAAPGIVSADGRSIWWMRGRLSELQGVDWTDYLKRAETVRVLNDAQAALLGEVQYGAAAGCANVMMLTLGTGVGGAAMVDGHMLRGHLGRAGHLGHISLDPEGQPDIVNTPGSLEDAFGNCTIERRSGGRFRSMGEMFDRLSLGDEHAKRIWRDSVRALAVGIASLVNVLDPEVVILGGGIVAANTILFDPLRAELDHVEWRPHGRAVRVVPATAGEYAGAIGAAWHAMKAT